MTMPLPDAGWVWTGAVSAVGPAQASEFVVSVNGVVWGTFQGTQQLTGVQAHPPDKVMVLASNLAPGAIYSIQWIGIAQTDDDPSSTFTQPQASGTATATRPAQFLDKVTVPSAGNVTKTYPLDPSARALTFLGERTSGAGLLTITVTGGTSGFQYANFIPALSGQRPALNHVEANAAIDSTLVVNFTTPGGTTFTVFVAEDYDPMVIGVESLPDTFNVIVEIVQKTPTESRVACGAGAATNLAVAGQAGYTRGFEVNVPYGSTVDANGVSLLVALGQAASATLGKGLVPGGYYARPDFNGQVSAWNPSGSTVNADVTLWF
ncbi:MAG: hypothetical protein ACREQ5_11765 [Candidatus Dormibacteria bacterium]